MDRKRLTATLLVGAAAAVLAIVAVLLVVDDPESEACDAYGVVVDAGPVVLGGHRLYVGLPADRRDPCQGDDLWHFDDAELELVDGVLFDDCVISWVSGGRSDAGDAGVPCEPAPVG